MKVVYPLGNGSIWDDKELKYSINSLLKYTNVTEIYIVGSVPRCNIDHDVFILPFESKFKHSAQRVANNLLCFMDKVCPNEFIIMNDDFFCNQNCDLSKLPLWYDKKISERMQKPGISSKYKYTLQKSIRDKEDLNFGVHFPLPIRHVDIFRESLNEAINTTNGCSYRNLYCNKVKSIEHIEQRNDLKFSRHTKTPEDVLQYDWFSIGEEYLLPHCKKFIIDTYS